MSDTRYKDAEWLHEQYHEHELSQKEIADKCGVEQRTVSYWMEKHGIGRRDRGGTSSDTRYRDAEWLHEQYHEQELSQREIADKCDISQKTVRNWMEKHDIERRNRGGTSSDARYKDAEWLHEQYHEQELSTYEIADKCGVDQKTVGNWMRKHDIERRGRGYGYNNCRTGVGILAQDGYRRWHEASLGKYVRVHRLLAVAEYGFDAVCDMDVHHQNGIKWDNRPDNIELLTRSEHAIHHAREQHDKDDTRYRDEEWLHEQYHEHELSTYEIADKCGVSARTVSYWMEKHGIGRRDRGRTSGDVRYKDAEWLHEQYHEKELSTYEIADKCGVYNTTVGNWMEKHDIERHNRRGTSSDTRYRDAEWLHEQYHEKELSTYEIADKCDVSHKTVSAWMEKHDIETRDRSERAKRTGVGIKSDCGYQVWDEGIDNKRVAVHRLLAVSEYGFDAVCDMDVHHKNGIRWDNRPGNIELLAHSEHIGHHSRERNDNGDTRYRDEEWLKEQYHDNGLTQCKIGDKCGVDQATVNYWMEKHDIERRDRRGTSSDTRYRDAEWLEEQYHEHELSTYEIADKCGVAQRTVSYWMEKHGIESREPGHNLRSETPTGQLTLDDTRKLEGAQTVNQ